MNNDNKRKYLQRGLAGLLILVVVAVCYMVVTYLDKTPKVRKKKLDTTEKSIETPTSRIDFQEIWRTEREDKEKQLQAQIKQLELMLKNQQKEEDNRVEEIHSLLNKVATEQGKAQAIASQPVLEKTSEEAAKIAKLTLNLSKKESTTLSSVDNTIPAGSFAEAVLLSGVDATASISAGANPRPMLLRLTNLTVLPRKYRSDLLDCHCVASAWGELSSERIHARLVKLSCVERNTGEILEVPAEGFISGADGKEGVRGTVASKEGQFLTRSLWGGVFAGIGNALSPANRTNQGGAFLSIGKPEKTSTKDMFKSGFGESSNNSLNRLSEYYIERAEQIQPVIQVSAGQKVDIVFTEGVSIEKTLTRKTQAEKNDVERKELIDK